MRLIRFLTALLVVAVPASAINLSGSMTVEYRDRAGGSGLITNYGHSYIRFSQASLKAVHEYNDDLEAAIRLAFTGSASSVSEAWFEFKNLPCDGGITIGQFYRPRGAPVELSGQSFAVSLFHSAPVRGVRARFAKYPWRFEFGGHNANALSATGASIGNSTAFGRPLGASGDSHQKEVYGHLGWADGGVWGSLDLGAMIRYGKMTRTGQSTIEGLEIITTSPDLSKRLGIDIAGDYMYGPWRISGEYSRHLDGRLRQTAYSGAIARRFDDIGFLRNPIVVLQHDRYSNNATNRPLAVPGSWHRNRVLYGIRGDWNPDGKWTPKMQFRIEYEHNREKITGTEPFTVDGIPNDGIIAQIVASF